MPALARACGEGENLARAKRRVELTDEEAQRVQKGEKPTFEGKEPGWTLMTCKGLPMGFVKVSKG
jgi:NOL1/NOP2/fmu family ribosome biogenesis protein